MENRAFGARLRLWITFVRMKWVQRRTGNRRWIERLMSETTTAANASGDGATPLARKVTLYLVRHGQTTYNVEKRLPGQLPGVALNDEGVRQAERLGEALRDLPVSAVISSPLERAQRTAEIVMSGRDMPILFDDRLMDTNVGRWAGQVIDDLNKNDPAWVRFVRHPTEPPEGIEGFYDVSQRVVAVAEEARHRNDLGDGIMLVAHADIIKLLICHYLRLPVEGVSWLGVPNASITALQFEGDRDPEMLALNWLPSPAWLRPPPPKPSGSQQPAAEPVNESVSTATPPPENRS